VPVYDYLLRMRTADDIELQRLRDMTASEKVAVMHSLWRQAWALKAAGVRALHPEWSAEQVEASVRSLFADETE
jgi:hypothetical protein